MDQLSWLPAILDRPSQYLYTQMGDSFSIYIVCGEAGFCEICYFVPFTADAILC